MLPKFKLAGNISYHRKQLLFHKNVQVVFISVDVWRVATLLYWCTLECGGIRKEKITY